MDTLESGKVFIRRDAVDRSDQPALTYAKVERTIEEEQAPAPGEQGFGQIGPWKPNVMKGNCCSQADTLCRGDAIWRSVLGQFS